MTDSISYPLTHAQESLYFLEQLTREQPVYNMPQAFRLRGRLNIPALEKALSLLVARHDALRTRIIETSEGPRQAPASPDEITFRVYEGSDALQNAVRERFDLQNGPIFRVDLFRAGEDEHIVLFNLHHIVGDMSSLGIIFQELSRAYSAFCNGTKPDFDGRVLQVGVFASEKRAKSVPEETLQFWRENLQDHTAELELPTDRWRPKYPSFGGAAHYYDLPADLRSALGELARKNRSSLYMVCLAALESLLYRYSGQERFAIATPFTDRDDPKLEQTIGYLINLLPIACDVRAGNTFRELLANVRAQCLTVYAHHETSFRRIIQELGIASDSPKPPLARVVFQYFPEMAALELQGLECEPIRVHSETSKFDLCVSMWETAGTITTEIEYDTDLYDESSVQRFARHFQNLLRAIATNPDQRVGDIALEDEAERQLIDQWSRPTAIYPREKTVHELFEEQVFKAPTKTALLFQNEQITYGELNEHANQIAQQLRASGVQTGDFVGVCLDRSPNLIAALIGILKVGAAFVPFEASYPKSRLEYLFTDSAVRVLVTDAKNAQIAPTGTKIIDLDWGGARLQPSLRAEESRKASAAKGRDAEAAAPEDVRTPEARQEAGTTEGTNRFAVGPRPTASAESIAYMMYTSGSTGNPKGAMIPHRAVVRLVKNNDFASFGADEIFLAFAPVSFDASTLEIWGPLLNGGTLAIYPPKFESIDQFEEVIQRHRVTTLWLTAGLFNTIVDRKVEALRGLRQLLVGGDVLSVTHIRKALQALPDTELINGYGPTENTTFTCCYRIPPDFPTNRSVPIGRPIRNTSVYILDERLRKTAIGVPGDLYAGGDGLSLGYWNKPELTERAFLPNPFEPHGRLYKTGDRARFLEDGTIEFLGRQDSQVKIRGFRIEIEEVEGAFRKIPGVQDVAVVAHPDNSGTKSLVAYVVLGAPASSPAAKDNSITPADLQSEIGKHLPAHACPSRIVFLPELPLGPNGKVNRAALPAPAHLPSSESEFSVPSNDIEEKLVELWRQILEVPVLGIDDNFFHLGGESLRATRAISQMNAAFHCRLSLPRMFEAPTIRQMARLVEHSQNEPPMPSIKSRIQRAPEAIPDASRLSELSEKDVDALLNELLATDEPGRK
jgi:amino acid adenylation domain-containing protein